jgi:osmotically-inducible protein OsmY
MVATDRRSAGTQLDDSAIEVRAADAVGKLLGDRGHVTATSYNRVVMLSGEVPTEADRNAVEASVRRIDNVRSVLNELAVMPSTTMSERTSDSVITGKVKAAFLDTKGVETAAIKVITERGNVYLLGRVTAAEADAATNAARGVGGVRKVVKVFEIVTPAEVAAMPMVPPQAASAPTK